MDYVDAPLIFTRLSLRSGEKFRSLSHHLFTFEEKYWVCDALSGANFSPPPMESIVSFCLQYDIKPASVSGWLTTYQHSHPVLNYPVDDLAAEAIEAFILTRMTNVDTFIAGVPATADEFSYFVNTQIDATEQRRRPFLSED